MDREIERCSLCVLPKSDYFNFDDHGSCGLCNAVRDTKLRIEDTQDTEGLERLEETIQRIRERGRGQSFDCVVAMSGGRDSSYLLYLLIQKHRLRCLAAYYRTPFTSDVTDANVRRLTGSMGVPLVELRISQEHHRRIAREFTVLWREKPHPVIANMACAPCKLINRDIFRIARANGIRAVVYGGNRFEAVQIASGVSRHASLTTSSTAAWYLGFWGQLQKSLLLIKRGAETLRVSNQLWRHVPLGFQAAIMYICPHTPYLRFRYPDILALEYFCFAKWPEEEIEGTLAQLGWELPPG